ncbi:MAG: hypothetical protein S4CHLAM2_13010 [Chlamydiales bacterium]|nr:hypothetical protein [Chlamydiales bacterium]
MAAPAQPAALDWAELTRKTDETIDAGARAAAETAKKVNDAAGRPAVRLAAERGLQAKAQLAFGGDADQLDLSIQAAAEISAQAYVDATNNSIDGSANVSARGSKAGAHGSVEVAKKIFA